MSETHLSYSRSRFRTRLPLDRLYTESHFWLRQEEQECWQIGFTRFATRMLGEIVEFDFEVEPDTRIEEGQVVGWIEGFKAVAELYSPMTGQFVAGNPQLDSIVGEIHNHPYDRGWLYTVRGQAPDTGMDADGYTAFLDGTIDRMMGRSA